MKDMQGNRLFKKKTPCSFVPTLTIAYENYICKLSLLPYVRQFRFTASQELQCV